jgi:hypothetical protein
VQGDQALRRGGDDLQSGAAQQAGKGGGVDAPQAAVEFRGRQAGGGVEAHRQVGLVDVAGGDIGLGLLDHGPELLGGDDGHGGRRGARLLRQGAAQSVADFLLPTGQVVAGIEGGQGHQAPLVIVYRCQVDPVQPQIRHRPIAPGAARQVLDAARQIVAEKAEKTAWKGAVPEPGPTAALLQDLFQGGEGLARHGGFAILGQARQALAVEAVGFQAAQWHDAVPPQARVGRRAFQKAGAIRAEPPMHPQSVKIIERETVLLTDH